MPQLDLSDDEAAVLVRVLRNAIDGDRYPLFASGPEAEGNPQQAEDGAGSRTLAAAEELRTAAGHRRKRKTGRVKSAPGPSMTLGAAIVFTAALFAIGGEYCPLSMLTQQ